MCTYVYVYLDSAGVEEELSQQHGCSGYVGTCVYVCMYTCTLTALEWRRSSPNNMGVVGMWVHVCTYVYMYLDGTGVEEELSQQHGCSGYVGTCVYVHVYVYLDGTGVEEELSQQHGCSEWGTSFLSCPL